jgi:tRNA nucleotidyltransferase/poly(A) polymerase
MTMIERNDNFMRSLGVEAYRVGGSVRDELLERRVKDCDYVVRGVGYAELGRKLLAAGAKPSPITDRNGRALGWRARMGTQHVEITLPRKEVSTGAGHRDFDIVMDPNLSLAEDAMRRDFTFNALYKMVGPAGMGGLGEIADPTSRGLYDLQHRLVATTYPTSFRDDPLRILRAFRFCSVLGYDMASHTQQEVIEHAGAVSGLTAKNYVSGTVYDEMSKILMGEGVAGVLRGMAAGGVLGTLFPELAPMIGFEQGSRYHDLATDEHTFTALETAAKVDAPLRVRWSLLFHDAGKPESSWTGPDGRKHYYASKVFDLDNGGEQRMTENHEDVSERLWRKAAERMNIPRGMREDVATLIRHHMVNCTGKVKASKVRRRRVQFGDEMLCDLHMHRMCDLSGKGNKNRNMLINMAQQEDIRRVSEATRVPASVKELEITGQDAMKLGLQGEQIGTALRAVLDEVAVDPKAANMRREWQLQRLEALGRTV